MLIINYLILRKIRRLELHAHELIVLITRSFSTKRGGDIMNKKGFTDKDVLEWIKIAILIMVGIIIIRALSSAI